MRSHERRREFLQLSGVAVATSLGGCVFGSGSGSNTTTSLGRSYSVKFDNRITKEDLIGKHHDGSEKATISLEVDRVVDGDNEVLFEKRVELGPGKSRTFEDAFRTEEGERYGVNAEMEAQPFAELSGRMRDNLRSGYVFDTGGENTPENGQVVATAIDAKDGKILVPFLELRGASPGT